MNLNAPNGRAQRRQTPFCKGRLCCTGLLILALMFGHAGRARADAQTSQEERTGRLRIIEGSGEAEIAVTQKRAGFTHFLRLETTGPEPIQALRVSIAPFLGPDSTRVDPEWKVNGQPGADATVPVPALGSADIEITATLPLPGEYSSSISLVYDGVRETRGLKVTRQAPEVAIAGLAESGEIVLERQAASVRHSFRIESRDRQGVESLRVFVAPFMGPDSERADPEWTISGKSGDQSVALAGLGSVDVTLSATLKRSGTYTSSISLVYDGTRQTRALKVNRTRVELPVEILSAGALRTSAGYFCGYPTLSITLQEKEGRDVLLYPPEITGLALTEGAGKTSAAQYRGVRVSGANGQEIADKLKLEPDQARHLNITLLGLAQVGSYAGTLRIAGPDAQAVTQAISVAIKAPWFIAVLWIAAGVLGSYFLREYATNVRPRLILSRTALALLSEIEEFWRDAGDLTEDGQTVLKTLERRLNDEYEKIQLGVDTNADALFNEIDEKLAIVPDWISGRRRVDAIEPPKLRPPFYETLKSVCDFLLKESPLAEETKEARQHVRDLAANIDKAVKSELLDTLKTFEAEVEAQRKVTATDPVRAKFDQLIRLEIPEVRRLAEEGKQIEARAKFDATRGGFAQALADSLAASLDRTAPPEGFDEARWNDLRGKLEQEIASIRRAPNAAQAINLYHAAFARYVRGIAEALQNVARQRARVISQTDKLLPEQKKKLGDRMAAVISQLDDAIRQADSDRPHEATTAYTAAKEALDELVQEATTAGVTMGAAAKAAPAEAPSGAAIPRAIGEALARLLPSRTERRRPTVETLMARLRTFDRWFTAVILIIAVLMGLQLLWVNEPTWGGWKDCLTAVLWGLGLHQVSNVAFEGAAGLKSRFSAGTRPQPG